MAEILEYFDNINIDVAKKKYYNVNKVNAVLEELHTLAAELVDENERQRRELEALRLQMNQKHDDSRKTQDLLTEMRDLYRDTLEKAHVRADGIVKEAEELRTKRAQEADEQVSLLAGQVQTCFEVLRRREEENLGILEGSLAQLMKALNRKEQSDVPVVPGDSSPENATDCDSVLAFDQKAGGSFPIAANAPAPAAMALSEVQTVSDQRFAEDDGALSMGGMSDGMDDDEEETGRPGESQLQELELQIRKLAEEINALESGDSSERGGMA